MQTRRSRLDEVSRLGAARNGFETQRASPGEQVQHARALHISSEQVEQRCAHRLGGGPNPKVLGRCEVASCELAADNPQAAGSGGRGIRTPKSLRTPVFKTGAIAILPALLP